MPIDANHEFTGDLFTLLNPYGLLGGVTTLGLFVTHGAVFLALKTTGELRARANRVAWIAGLATAVVAVAFLAWTQQQRGDTASLVVSGLAAVALVGAIVANRLRREGWAFIGTALTIVFAVVALFVALFPDVMPSSTDPANSLTTTNAASTPYTLSIMTVVAVLFTPLVLLYQGWTYWVFRRRVSVDLPPTDDDVTGPPGRRRPNRGPPAGRAATCPARDS